MALNEQQIKELNIAQTRVDQGTPGTEDVKNLEFAKTQGFEPVAVSGQSDEAVSTAPTVPVKLDVEPVIPVDVLDQSPVTSNDISQQLLAGQQRQELQTQNFLTEIKGLKEQTLEATKPTEQETELITDIGDITQQARVLRASFKGGIDQITGQAIPLSIAMGQTRELENQANRRLEALSISQAPLVDTLNTLQSAREVKLTQLNILTDFARDNFALLRQDAQANKEIQLQIFEIQREEQRFKQQEQQVAKEFAFENNITAPFYRAGGIIYNTQTGESIYRQVGRGIETLDGSIKFNTPEQFFAHSGLTNFDQIQDAPTQGSQEEKALVFDLISKYPDAGISPGDDFATAQSRLPNSRIYQDQVRPPISLGSGTGISSTITTETFNDEFIPQNFEEFIAEKSQEQNRSIAFPEEFRQEFENKLISDEIQFANDQLQQEKQLLNQVSPEAKLVYNNENALENFTNTRKGEILTELASAGLTPGGLGRKQGNKLRAEFTALSKDFVKQRNSISRVRASGKDPSGAGDLALIFNFMKVLDPASVVRESEFATAENTGSVPERIWARYNKILTGQRLSPAQREDFLDRAEKLFDEAVINNSQLVSEFTRLSEQANVNPDAVIIKFESSVNQPTPDGLTDDEAFQKYLQITQ